MLRAFLNNLSPPHASRTVDYDILLGVTGVMFLCGFALYSVGVSPFRPASYVANALNYLSAWVFLFASHLLYRLAIHRPERPIEFVLNKEFGPDYRLGIRNSLPIIFALVVFMPMFSTIKSSIPLFNNYQWDIYLIRLDRQIHGDDPWRIIHPIAGNPLITSAFSLAYHAWILLIYVGGLYFALYVKNAELRRRYFASYFAIWTIIGIVLATMFASVGPCFVGRIFEIDVFDEQMAYLNRANDQFPIFTIEVQDKLIGWYHSGSHGLGRGITAMPSMHVALSFLFFLSMHRISRIAGWIFGSFFIIILIGSVPLAYHYAIDGYVSIIVTAIIWKVSGLWQLGAAENAMGERKGRAFAE